MTDVKNVIIWGNHSSTQFPDVAHGTVGGKYPIAEAVHDDAWLKGEFVSTVQQRGAVIIKVRSKAEVLLIRGLTSKLGGRMRLLYVCSQMYGHAGLA